MARLVQKLTDLRVRQAMSPGRYSDGEGLYLQVTASRDGARLNRSWLLRVRVPKLNEDGRLKTVVREMGLGRYPAVSLADARRKAEAARQVAANGDDPISAAGRIVEAKLLAEREALAVEARAMTFEQCAEAYVEAHKSRWRSGKHAGQWTATLKTYAYPVFGKVAVSAIDVAMVTKVLDPIWTSKAETARRLRGRVEAVLDWATVRGHRSGDNPARWKGHLQKALPARPKRSNDHHHAALPYEKIAEFLTILSTQQGMAARALELTILTAARTGEIVGARWAEFDLVKKIWTIPAQRMKSGREHRVPLSPQALAILRALPEQRAANTVCEWVFSPDRRRPMSNMAMLMMLRRMKRDDLTVHGFRSTFRDWAAERTGFPAEVAEAALAHTINSKVEAAYRRGDLFEKRRRLMQAWADYGTTQPAEKIVSLQSYVAADRQQ